MFSLGSVLAFAATGTPPFSGGTGSSSASAMYRIVHSAPDLAAMPGDLRELVGACLAKDVRRRPDPGRIAAGSAAVADRLGLAAGGFWPDAAARVIQAHEAETAARISSLQRGSGVPAAGSLPAPAMPARPPGTFPPHPGELTGRRAAPGASRRGLLIGAGVGGIAVVGGAVGWALNARPTASSPTAAGAPSVHLALPTGSALQGYYGAGQRRSATWAFATNNAIEADPGTGNGVVFVASTDNNLYAITAATGKQAWSVVVGSVTAAPQVVGDVVLASTTTGQFSALRAASGARAWGLDTEVPAAFKPNWAVNGTSVILGQELSPPQAFDAATGAKGVVYQTQQPYLLALAVASGVLYALDASGVLYAFNAGSGAAIWHKQLLTSDEQPGTGITADGTSVYLGTTAGTLYVVDAASGAVAWTYHPGSGMTSAVTVAGGLVYLNDDRGTLHAVDLATRRDARTRSGVPTGEFGVAVAGGRVYYSTGLAVQALDAKKGTPIWAFSLQSSTAEFLSTPAVAGGLVFIGSNDSSLYAITA